MASATAHVLLDKTVKQDIEYWANRHKCHATQWHIDEVHPHLLKYLSQLTQQSWEKPGVEKKLKFFVPLCGKTKDIPFLVNLGFQVFGVEAVHSVVEELTQENNLELEFDDSRLLYHNKENTLQIYCGDFFKCPIEQYGPFDCVWDRNSFIALDYSFRPAYLEVMKRSVGYGSKHDFRYLLQSVKYQKAKTTGPPRAVYEEDIDSFFRSWADVTFLERNLVNLNHHQRNISGYYDDDVFEQFHMVQPKHGLM